MFGTGTRKWLSYRTLIRLLLGVSAALLFVETFEFRSLEETTFGPETWPRVVLIILFICVAIDIFNSLTDKKDSESRDVDEFLNWNRVVGFTICLGGYVVGMMVLGFPLTTFVFCWIVLVFHGIRNWKVCASIAIGVTVVSVLLFLRVLYVSLPRGMWVFFDATNFLLSFIGR